MPSLSINDVSAAKNAGTAQFTVTLSGASSQTVTVDYATSDGTAAAGTEYIAISTGTLTFTPGTTSQTFDVTIADDSTDENDKTFSVNLSGGTNATISDPSGVATITDDDNPPDISFTSSASSTGDETAILRSVEVSLSSASEKTITINVADTASGTATDTVDYILTTSSPEILTFNPGETTKTLTFTPVVDSIDEDTGETIIFTLSSATNATLIAPTSHTAIITDDDGAPTVNFSSSSSSGPENITTVDIPVQLSNLTILDVNIDYTVTAGTATGSGVDYTLADGQITISAGTTSNNISFTVNNDLIDENNEDFQITLTNVASANATIGTTLTHTYTINDDDNAPTVSFSSASQASANESNIMIVTAELSAASSFNITVPFNINVSSTAINSTDYNITGSPLNIPAGSTSQDITITIVADTLDENNETIVIDMNTPTNATLGGITTHTATITDDDDAPTVSFTSPSQASANESNTMTVTAELSAASSFNITVPFNINVSSTAINSTDYNITGSPLNIPAGSTSQDITITIVADTLDENNETIVIDMVSPVNATLGTTTTHTATITDDDDAPTVSFTSASQASANESNTMTVTAELSAASSFNVTVPFNINGSSTATNSTDYNITGSPLNIPAGTTTQDITITIVTDTLDENNETIVIDMVTPANATLGTTTTHTATITDDDETPSVTFTSSSQYSTNETGTMTITAQLSAASSFDVSVPFSINGSSTAALSTDYTISGIPLTISAGSTTQDMTINIATDGLDENNETIIIDMETPSNATFGAITTHTATITDDDDTPTVSFTSPSQSSIDETGTITIIAQLSAASSFDVSLPFSINVSSTASAPSDYTLATTSPVTISAGSSTQTIKLNITEDSFDEDDETVIIDMGTPTNATPGATTTHTATITDDEPTPSLSIDDVSKGESDGTAHFTVTLSAASNKTVTVDYTTFDIDATAGFDYTAIATSTLIFNPGITSQNITVTILPDSDIEGNENYKINLTNPGNATIIDTEGIGTIVDDDSTPAGQNTNYTTSGGPTFNMIYIPGSLEFMEGVDDSGDIDNDSTPDILPKASIISAYEIGETEVTYELWEAVRVWAVSNGYTFGNIGYMGETDGGSGETNQHPVTKVNWRDAIVWCNALTEYYNNQNGTSLSFVYASDNNFTTPIRVSTNSLSVDYPNPGSEDHPFVNLSADGFRLPTVQEWSCAARYKGNDSTNGAYESPPSSGIYWQPGNYTIGDTTDYLSSSSIGDYAWYSGNTITTNVVGTTLPNSMGLYDMNGNVYEWNMNWYPGSEGSYRITRGGSYNDTSDLLQVGYWESSFPDSEYTDVGFRICKSEVAGLKNILAFNLLATNNGPAGLSSDVIGDIKGAQITLSVPTGTIVSKLVPDIITNGSSISPNSGTEQDFTNPVTYTVTAADFSTIDYTVKAKVFEVVDYNNVSILTDEWLYYGPFESDGIEVDLFQISGDSDLYVRLGAVPDDVNHDCGPYKSGIDEKCNLNAPGQYFIAVNGYNDSNYDLSIKHYPMDTSNLKNITTFKFLASNNSLAVLPSDSIGSIVGTNITLDVPTGTDITQLIPDITINGSSISPDNGAIQDFTNPVVYTVTADDASTKDYTVTVKVYALDEYNNININTDQWLYYGPYFSNEIDVNLIQNSGDSDLYVRFGAWPDDVNYDCKSTSAGSNENCNISGQGNYYIGVTGFDNSNYNLLIYNYPIDPAALNYILTFNLLSSENVIANLPMDETGILNGSNIILAVPFGTDYTKLIPDITINGSSISPLDGGEQNFTNPITYTVTAPDLSTRDYNVSVKIYDDFNNISINKNSWNDYGPYTNTESIDVKMLQISGDSDLYVRLGAWPDDVDYDCKSSGISDEECIVSGPGDYYIRVFGYSNSDYDLIIKYDP